MEKRKPPNDMYEFYRLGMDILENSRARIASISTTLGQGSSIERGRGKAGRRTRELKGENKVAARPSPTYLRPPKRGLRVGRSKIFSDIPAGPIPHLERRCRKKRVENFA